MSKTIIVKGRCRGCQVVRETQIVRSRAGGFVTRDCLTCGTSNSVRPEHLPSNLRCPRCSSPGKDVFVRPTMNGAGNYALTCDCCDRIWVLADMVPAWQQRFRECGFGLDTDVHAR